MFDREKRNQSQDDIRNHKEKSGFGKTPHQASPEDGWAKQKTAPRIFLHSAPGPHLIIDPGNDETQKEHRDAGPAGTGRLNAQFPMAGEEAIEDPEDGEPGHGGDSQGLQNNGPAIQQYCPL